MPDAREAIIVAQNSSTAAATLLQGWAEGQDIDVVIGAFVQAHGVIFNNAFDAAAGAQVETAFTNVVGAPATVTYGEGFPPPPPAPPVQASTTIAYSTPDSGPPAQSDSAKAQAFLAGYSGNFPFLVDLKSKASRGLSEKQVASVLKCAARER